MTLETESGAIIKKIEEQCNGIIEKITHRQASKNLHQIEVWVKQQINSQFSTDNFELLAIVIDTIHQYLKTESDKEKTNIIENCFANLIYSWGKLPDSKLLNIVSDLKIYNKNNDKDAKAALKQFIGKKVKARVIAFDEDGIGFDASSPYLFFKEINRLNEINLEIELPTKIKKKILLEAILNKELERLTRIEINAESSVSKIERKIKIKEFDLFASQEEKDARLAKIKQKRENNKKDWERQKMSKLLIPKILPILKRIDIYKNTFDYQSLSIEFPSFETNKDDFLSGYLRTIDYQKFKKLINFTEYILISIGKIKQTLKKIDDFSKGLGVASNYVHDLDSCYTKIKENFNKETISNFLENSLILFEQRTLALDNNYCLLDRLNEKNEIVFSDYSFLDKFISKNNNKQIYKILYDEIKQFLNKKVSDQIYKRNKNYKNKRNLIKKFLSFFDEEYYFTSRKFKRKFIKKVFSNVSEPDSVEAMKNIIDNLSWRKFFLFHVGIIFLLRKEFRARLSEELFLDLLEERFNKIDEKKDPNVKNIDELYSIKNHINSLKSKLPNHSIDLKSLNFLDSRQEIVCRLKNHKKIKNLLDNVKILSNQASDCIQEFNNLQNACSRECKKITENGETFQINKNEVSKLHFPLKWRR